eukprot:CAMPEP_0172450362 /NCGR_PEP_ID=MMETSP1065-20121228/8731_1 /TAXON_ID=265537 /ORGANISM="Amphiprora paludosa, Strain CCMP125" /LENGTH=330 /DNA_ID=CAMNT_0013202141 /DNA_START=12 /DNA_END=1004 /DNA_ORIENTATION=+
MEANARSSLSYQDRRVKLLSQGVDVENGESDIVCVVKPEQVLDQETLCTVHDVETDTQRRERTTRSPSEANFSGEDDCSIPFAMASALTEPLLSPASLYFVESMPAQPVPDRTMEESSFLSLRPEFLYATAIKPSSDTPVGLAFAKIDGMIVLTKVNPTGLFRGTGLQVGDRVIAINSFNCMDFAVNQVVNMIREAEQTVSICVWNKHGEPSLVQSSIQKPTRKSRLGISFQMRNGALSVSRVNVKGLFADSLLMPDHRCFLLNGQSCDTLDSFSAASITTKADRVTIASRARGNFATVLSVGAQERRRWSAVAMGAATAAVALGAMGSL